MSLAAFFFHLPKCAGNTIIQSAKAALGEQHVCGIYDTEASGRSTDEIPRRISRLMAAGDVAIFHSHLSPAKVPVSLPLVRTMAFRQPIDRVQSSFCYMHDGRYHLPDARRFFWEYRKQAFGGDELEQFIGAFNLDNFATRFMSGRMSGVLGDAEFSSAKMRMSELHLVGLTEHLGTYLGRLGVLIGGAPIKAVAMENQSNRHILRLSPNEQLRIQKRHFEMDDELYRMAIGLSNAASESKTYSILQTLKPPMPLYRVRRRTVREIVDRACHFARILLWRLRRR